MLSKIYNTDIELGGLCSRTAYTWAEKTFNNAAKNKGMPNKNLRGSFANVIVFNSLNLAIASDGIGTKIEIAERLKKYDTLGFDLVSMIVDDLICLGAIPTTLSNILDVDYLDHEIINELMKGLYLAANDAKIVVTGGEIAELGNRVSGYGDTMHFNWCATGLGMIEPNKVIDGTKISKGDVVIALNSPGFRSNGFSLARSILQSKYGNNWHEEPADSTHNWGEVLLTASLIYAPFITALLIDGAKINGIAHITGGGIAENFSRILRQTNLGAKLDNLFEPDDAVLTLQSLGELSEETVYRHWNMGNGMLLVVANDMANKILAYANGTKYAVKKAGVITKTPIIELHSLGNEKRILKYALC